MSYERSKAPLALMEQIIMILVFALTAAVCMQAFVYSSSLSKQGENKNIAAGYAQEVAEYCKTEKGNIDLICQQLSGKRTEDGFTVSYKEDEMNVYVQMVESPTVLQKAKVTVKSNDAIEYYSMEIAWQKGGVRP